MTLRCSKMAESVQMFLFILIKKNAHLSNIYDKRSTRYVQETREKLRATTNQTRKNYPVLISMCTGNNTTNLQQLNKKNSNPWSYEAPDLDKKLITGNLPKSFFSGTKKFSDTGKTATKKKTPNVEENITERKLWSRKDGKKSRDLGIQVAPRILEVRHRRKQHVENVAEQTQKSKHSRVEVIRREEALEMRRVKNEWLDKMEEQQILSHTGRSSIKRQCNNLSFTRQIMS